MKAVTLGLCIIQSHFVGGIRAKLGIPNLPKSLDIGKKSDGGILDFRISGQFFINENCHNSIASHGIDMKLGPVTKGDKRNMATPKKIKNDVILVNCDVIIFFPIYDQFAIIRKPDSGGMVL